MSNKTKETSSAGAIRPEAEDEDAVEMSEEKFAQTPLEEIPDLVKELRENFWNNQPVSVETRLWQLSQLEKLIRDNEDQLLDACQQYFGENYDTQWQWATRLFIVLKEIREMMNALPSLMRRGKTPLQLPYSLMWSASEEPEPRGVVLIISPWNYPLQLTFRALIGAIAAGNCVVMKPSEVTDGVARVVADLIPRYLDSRFFRVVCGGPAVVRSLIAQRLDFVLFTGGTRIGSAVMKLCAEHVTECLLELGGKNPVFLDDSADIQMAATRIANGRFNCNAGQVCVSPQYVFVSKSRANALIDAIGAKLKEWHCKDGTRIGESKHFGRVVVARHWHRLNTIRKHYVESADESTRNKVAIGGVDDEWFTGKPDEETRFMPPLILKGIDFENDKIMEEEVFGPFLCVIPMEGPCDDWKQEAVDLVRKTMWKPLACYVFSTDQKFIDFINCRVAAGSVVTNAVITQVILPLKFGGTGLSGFGHYGGEHSFYAFSHMKPLAQRSANFEWVENWMYPGPHMSKTRSLFEFVLLPAKPSSVRSALKLAFVVAGAGVLLYALRDTAAVKQTIDFVSSALHGI